MRRVQALLLITLAACPGAIARADDGRSIGGFLGEWSGAEIVAGRGSLAPSALDLRVEQDAGGFAMAWHDLGAGGDLVEARFLPTDRPGVYEVARESSSFLTRMFAAPATGNPLKGETLLWARIEDPVLAVYSMSVDRKGAMDLAHYTWTRTEDGLRLSFSDSAGSRIEGTLAAAGG
jgi:hypothetical protein